MQADNRRPILLTLSLLAVCLLVYPWAQARRVGKPLADETRYLLVTSPVDGGPGSLRTAIFQAVRSGGQITITIQPTHIQVASSLPPLAGNLELQIQPAGDEPVTIEGLEGYPLFDIRSESVTFERLRIVGPAIEAMRVSNEAQLTLRDIAIEGAATGVNALGGFDLHILNSRIEATISGVTLGGTGNTLIMNTAMRGYSEAGVWAAQAGSTPNSGRMEISNSSFEGGRYGLMLANTSTLVQNTTVSKFALDGVIAYAGRLDFLNSDVGPGSRAGIRAVGAVSGSIVGNRVHDNLSAGIMLQAIGSVRVEDNRVYRNGFGIATVLTAQPAAARLINNLVFSQTGDGFVIVGDSPILSGNRAIGNAAAGIRIYTVLDGVRAREAKPLMNDNTLEGNGSDEPVLQDYWFEN